MSTNTWLRIFSPIWSHWTDVLLTLSKLSKLFKPVSKKRPSLSSLLYQLEVIRTSCYTHPYDHIQHTVLMTRLKTFTVNRQSITICNKNNNENKECLTCETIAGQIMTAILLNYSKRWLGKHQASRLAKV